MGFRVGDEVVTANPLWHRGVNIGDRLAKVICTKGHILIEVTNYENNPVKCFRNEISRVGQDKNITIEEEVENLFSDLTFDIDFDFDIDPD